MSKRYFIELRNEDKTRVMYLPQRFRTEKSAEKFIKNINSFDSGFVEGVIHDACEGDPKIRLIDFMAFVFCFLLFCVLLLLSYDLIIEFVVFLMSKKG